MRVVPKLQSSFPGLRVVELKMQGLEVDSVDPALESFKREVQAGLRQAIGTASFSSANGTVSWSAVCLDDES